MPSIFSKVHESVTMNDNGEPLEIVFPATIGDGDDDGLTQAQADFLVRIRANEDEYYIVSDEEAKAAAAAPKTKKPAKKKESESAPSNTVSGTGTGLDGLPIPTI